MGFVLITVCIYLIIGVFKASAHLSSGRVGLSGPLATFVAVTLLWIVL